MILNCRNMACPAGLFKLRKLRPLRNLCASCGKKLNRKGRKESTAKESKN